jgi:hypothetical protein
MPMPRPLARIFEPAYRCAEFDNDCRGMRWQPDAGYVPRGFYGATGDLSDVELILVVAEPGDPHPGETHSGLSSASPYEYAGKVLRAGRDKFHKNLKEIFELCWPVTSLEERMRKVWITESVLCSAHEEGGRVPQRSCLACGRRYLAPQLKLFPNALLVACGKKAQERLVMLHVRDFLTVSAVAPPEGNKRRARDSWKQIPVALAARKSERLKCGSGRKKI